MQVGMKFRILGTAIFALLAVAFEGGKARKQGSEMLRAFAFYNGRNIRNPNELVIAESSLRDVASIGPLKFLIFCFGIGIAVLFSRSKGQLHICDAGELDFRCVNRSAKSCNLPDV